MMRLFDLERRSQNGRLQRSLPAYAVTERIIGVWRMRIYQQQGQMLVSLYLLVYDVIVA